MMKRTFSPEEKERIILKAGEASSIGDLCQEEGISRSTFYYWKRNYEKEGLPGLRRRSTKPIINPNKTPILVEETIVETKNQHPYMGCAQIANYLKRFKGLVVGAKTVGRILDKHGFEPLSASAFGAKEIRRFEAEGPNELWQADILTLNIKKTRYYLFSLLDDHSRFITGWGLFRAADADTLLKVIKAATRQYGIPKKLLTDNGLQFVSPHGESHFTKVLEEIGIKHITSAPFHPQTLGKLEAYHKTLRRELISLRFFESSSEAKKEILRFNEQYNYERPHSGCEGLTPGDRYFGVASQLKSIFDPGDIPPIYLVGRFFEKDIRLVWDRKKINMFINNNEVASFPV
jgi:transposase InsO family protein